MSLLCLCVIENIDKNDEILYSQQIEKISKLYGYGIKYGVDWIEPIASQIKCDSLIISITDCPTSNNCELFLLPDGWYANGQTNPLIFKERMIFLQEIASIFSTPKHTVNFYLAESGTDSKEYSETYLKSNELVCYLTNTVGVYGINTGVHIIIIQ